ncbi:3-methylfumaryl-CoA hydratase [Hoeflea marina]|uniref:3-methylfumaryl-CoA hydratase n=1 Tax=Hoeflea marina TaxID=274592 RepID=A0A317PUV0_9HYPH|nr:MaoC family dehydratase N-terminal domain-containing protein [Hoeflea marina]PWW04036.1 3-methylfumaryl-CoA hydratase [Hoeflea marina]
MSALDIEHLRGWIGRTQEKSDTVSPRLVESFNALFDAESGIAAGDIAPLGIHWCLAPDIAPMHVLGPDGHPARGGFLPPVPLQRRMWAGGRMQSPGDIRVGDIVTRRSRIEDVTEKSGRSGPLVFVTVRHDYVTPRGVALGERQDIVYRDRETGGTGRTAPTTGPGPEPIRAEHSRQIKASPTLLFRYSALTFNGHRIHYDLPYAMDVEQYPGLVFHGPLQATCLMRLAAEIAGTPLASFDYRSVAPLYAGGEISLHAAESQAGLDLWVADASHNVTMKATAVLCAG